MIESLSPPPEAPDRPPRAHRFPLRSPRASPPCTPRARPSHLTRRGTASKADGALLRKLLNGTYLSMRREETRWDGSLTHGGTHAQHPACGCIPITICSVE